MDINKAGIDLILLSEGKKTRLPDGRYKSYLDTLPKVPVWTIWAGLTKGVTAGTVWTEEECLSRFRKELCVYEDAVERMVSVPLNENEFSACVSLVYNIGEGSPSDTEHKRGFYWSTLRKLLNQGKRAEAATQFHRFNKSGGVVYNGLVTRRAAEAALFMTPVSALMESDPVTVEHPGEQPHIDLDTIIPQSVDAPQVNVTKAAAKSPSVLSAFLGMASSAIATAYGWVSGVASDATAEVGKTAPSVSGLDALWHLLKLNTAAILGFVTLACLAVVLVRKLNAIREGA